MTTLHDILTAPLEVRPPIAAGPLLLFPVFTAAASAPPYVCGPQIEADNLLHVHEKEGGGAAVPELVLTHGAGLPLLLLEGETMLGARQNRTLNVTVLCLPDVPATLPVSCVEAGRWGAARPTTRSPNIAPSGLRAAKTRSVGDSMRARAAKFSDQGEVWAHVGAYSDRHAAASPTAALEDVAQSIGPQIDALVAELRPADGQRGVIVAAGEHIVSLDLFDKPETLALYWDGLVAGYAVEAIGTTPPMLSEADARAFVDRVLGAPATDAPGVALGTELHLADGRLTGSALAWEGSLVHVAAFETSASRPDGPIERRW
ncbi:MAG: ARPP-1 family domain-containing protein [Acidimicrobiia bacterium]